MSSLADKHNYPSLLGHTQLLQGVGVWHNRENEESGSDPPQSTTQAFGEGDGTPLQYTCLENSMDGGAW